MRLSAVRFARHAVLAVVLLNACASAPQPVMPQPEVAPTMTLERFLRAANQNDLDTMAALFGTRDGSVTRNWSRQEVDDRMFLLASVLRHSDYTIMGEQIVPGRRDVATRFVVQMVIDQDTVQVPFTMVRTRSNHWLVEQVDIDRVTRGRGTP